MDEFDKSNSKLLFEIDFTNKIGSNVEIINLEKTVVLLGSYNDSYSCNTLLQI